MADGRKIGSTGGLYVVGTPIGNLGDLTPRARDALASSDVVACEDTRVTGRLLSLAGVARPLLRCDENVIARRAPELVSRMLGGETVAFASDAGMPGISDPGQVLVDAARDAGLPVEVVPGPTAAITALVSSGIACDHFFFEGFLPRRDGERRARLERLAPVPGALIFYESPHRVAATLDTIAEVFPGRTVALARELTKLHEEVLRAAAPDLAEEIHRRGEMRGEMVVVVAPPDSAELERFELPGARGSHDASRRDIDAELRSDIRAALEDGEGASSIAKRLSQRYSRRRREVYSLVLELSGDADS